MISLRLMRDRFDRWLCLMLGHKPKASSIGNLVPIKVVCGRCGESVSLVGRP